LTVRLAAERGRRLDRAFSEVAGRLDPRDRAFAHELAYGVTRLRGRIDHLLTPHLRRGVDGTDAEALELLRVGAYQLLYMGGVPAYAAVSETVDLARALIGSRPAGFVNAVLRRVQEGGAGPDRFPDPEADPLGFLVTWGSHPEWLVTRWLDRWGFADTRALIERNNARPSTFVVPLLMEPAEAVARLEAAGLEASSVGQGTGCVALADGVSVAEVLARIPEAVVQDPAAHLVTRYADVPSGILVTDLCAAPGGKALALSGRPSTILAADRSESRLRMLKENAQRTGVPVHLVVADALAPPITRSDAVLLDVPCTGTGTLSRHPDARWRLRPGSIGEMVRLQDRMLDAAADVVAPDGLLVYSTCSLEPEENQDRVAAFRERRPDFVTEATTAVPSEYLNQWGSLEVTPQRSGFDGSFAARMRKVT
jgi:16S rRNA (cytosine967-C5)-methyltransferase